MFTRPDWRDEASYEHLLDHDYSSEEIAWEFLRRNPEYAENVEACMATGQPNSREWDLAFRGAWAMRRAVSPSEDGGWVDFLWPTVDEPETFLPIVDNVIRGPRVLVPVDLSEPLEILEARLRNTIKELRWEGERQGTVFPRSTRVLSRRLYVEYLRILDAIEGGETYSTIGQILAPQAANEPDDRQRNKRIRAAHRAAKAMVNDGYRRLLTD